MRSLYDPERVQEIHDRAARLTPDSARDWGTMTVSQGLEHMAKSLRMAVGEDRTPRLFVGRLLGGLVKNLVLRDDKPMHRNSPTAPSLVVKGNPDFETQRTAVLALVDRFQAAGPRGCTTHPHPFFGKLTPEEWGTLVHKHLDHHLRQFGV
jgi:hypothetical protein